MKKFIVFGVFLILLILGETYFREPFTYIWAVLGILLFILLLVYQFIPGKNKPRKKSL